MNSSMAVYRTWLGELGSFAEMMRDTPGEVPVVRACFQLTKIPAPIGAGIVGKRGQDPKVL